MPISILCIIFCLVVLGFGLADYAANLDTVTTIPNDALRERLTLLSRAKMVAVDAALRFALGLQT